MKFHSSRLNDLLGVEFTEKDNNKKTKYVLFNPWAVRTSGALEVYDSPIKNMFTKLIYKLIGTPVEKAIIPIIILLEKPPKETLTAYKQEKEISLKMETFNKNNAKKLDALTIKLLKNQGFCN